MPVIFTADIETLRYTSGAVSNLVLLVDIVFFKRSSQKKLRRFVGHRWFM